jgi:hypothetical protein
MQRILFLDVDGPLIPSGMYAINLRASWERLCSPICIAIVNQICEDSGCKIVLNSTHSRDGAKAIEDLEREGLRHFHDSVPTTRYPSKGHSSNARWYAVQKWIEKSGEEINWIAIDDDPFTQNKRLIVVDFDIGITWKEYTKAAEIWGFKKKLIL